MGFPLAVFTMGEETSGGYDWQFYLPLDSSKLENLKLFIEVCVSGGIWFSRSRQGIVGGMSVIFKKKTSYS